MVSISPRRMRHIHGALTIAWCVVWVAAWVFGWLHSVAFVSHVSMAALVLTSAGAWQGARAEEKSHNVQATLDLDNDGV